MKVVALISGGKDSCYNMMQCASEGHHIVALANLRPKHKDELDSYMYQTVGHHAIDLYAEAMGLPLYRRTIEGASVVQDMDYKHNPQDEVEDLYLLLKQIKEELGVEGVSVGAILSDYQRIRVENVCARLGLTSLAYLWRRDQEELLQEMIMCGVHAIIIKVAAMGLEPAKHLKKSLAQIQPHMMKMKDMYGLNVCGEGGEYETFTLDCPLFNKRIVMDETEEVLHSYDQFAPVGYINFIKMHLEDKGLDTNEQIISRLTDLPMKRGADLYRELYPEGEECKPVEDIIKTDTCIKCIQRRLKGDHHRGVSRVTGGFTYVTGVRAKIEENRSIEDMTTAAMQTLHERLSEHGLDMSDLVVVHLYVDNMKNFARVNSVYKKYFSINPPARVCVEVALPDNFGLQIDCVGYRGDLPRRTMHVQGLSHWAPANIGPYSQAVKIGDMIYVAGQIAMCPVDLSIIGGGAGPQSRLSLRHVQRILQAMNPGTGLLQLALVVCYVTDKAYIDTSQREITRILALETEGHESQDNGPMIEYVIVPSLPKDAKVEWQVCASADRRHRTGQLIEKHLKDVQLRFNYLVTRGKPNLFTVKSSVDYNHSRSGADLLGALCREILSLILRTLKEIHEESQLTLAVREEEELEEDSQTDVSLSLRSVRIFYRNDCIDPQMLSKEYLEEACCLFGEDFPVPAIIPVLGFSTDKQILSFCM